MNEIPTIQKIKDLMKMIKESMQNMNVSANGDQRFGHEGEYTYSDMLNELSALLTDIYALVKNTVVFLKLSTHVERDKIANALKDVHNHVQDPNILCNHLDSLKQSIRPFHVRYTKERMVRLDEELLELAQKKEHFARMLVQLINQLDDAEENKNRSDEMLQSLEKQKQDLAASIQEGAQKNEELEEQKKRASTDSARIQEVKNACDSHQQVVDNFVKKIVERDGQLTDQKAHTEDYEKHLVEFKSKHDELLGIANGLIEQAKTALSYKKAVGISAAFQEKLEGMKEEKNHSWLWGAGASVALAIALGVWFFWELSGDPELLKSVGLTYIAARISFVILPLTGALFCARQYTKRKAIIDDYTYKTVLAQSIIGFSEQLKNKVDDNDTSYRDYIKKMLDELHQHPHVDHSKVKIKSDKTDESIEIMERMESLVKLIKGS